MPAPLKYDFEMTAGDTGLLGINYKDSNGEPINLDNTIVKMSLKENILDNYPVIEAEATVNGNEIRFKIPADQTFSLNKNKKRQRYVYDVQITYSDGDVETILSGKVTVLAGVTDN